MRVGFVAMSVMVFLGVAVQSQAQTLDKVYGDWNVFTMRSGGTTICYMASAPVKKTGNYNKRGEPYMLVTHRSASVDEVSVSSGYPYKKGGEVTLKVDGKQSYNLFTQGELAWAYTESADKKIVNAVKAGSKITVRGTSQRGTYSQDTYSLKGSTDAYKRMKSMCK